VSFCGGGTDIASFYKNDVEGGRVTSFSFARYVYVTVNKRFDDSVRVSYSKTEIVDDFEDLEHELVREAMRLTGVTSGVEITTIAEIPSRGTGLGSSSAVTVGLLNALHHFAGSNPDSITLAEQACKIEIDILGQPIGKQDQYAAAFGGINHFQFRSDGIVIIEPLSVERSAASDFVKNFTLLYTGITRSANQILEEQIENTVDKSEMLVQIRDQASLARELIEAGDVVKLAELLNKAWEMKQTLASGITIPEINELYSEILSSGSKGGKLLGAGGGGFILFQSDGNIREELSKRLPNNQQLNLDIDWEGSIILHGN
tara:strand:+ start:764 stop:1714 length:951 start_codon:yes stop_codon:yes gene_type:complete